MLAYVAPLGALLILSILTKSNNILFNFLIIIFCWFYLIIIYKFLFLDSFYFGNGLLAFITYSSFFPLLAIPSKSFDGEKIFFKISKILLVIILIECGIGFVQSIYGFFEIGTFDLNNGDYIEGTIHLPLDTERSMSNPIFSIIISSILIFLVAYYRITKLGKINIIIGLLILLMATTMHVIIFLFLSYILTSLFLKPPSKNIVKKIFSFITIGSIIIVFSNILPSNFGAIYNHGKVLLENKYPKTAVIVNYYNKIINNNILKNSVGLGPGQFLSRASFISTGKYFGTNSSGINKLEIPFTGMTPSFKKGVDYYWMRSINEAGFGSSSTSKPQSSWNAFLTEFGIIGSMCLLIYLLLFLIQIKRKIRHQYSYSIGFSLIWCLAFMFLIGFQENYWEIPQAIFIGFILMKISHSILIKNNLSNHL
jgi:hypothetical protein